MTQLSYVEQPSSFVLVGGISRPRDCFIMVFGSYIDESGSHDQKLLVIAAYVATAESWSLFDEYWKNEVLSKYSLPYFHLKDFRNGHSKLFRHLSRDQKDSLLADIVEGINRYLLFGVISTIHPHEYNAVTTPQFRNCFGSVYSFGVALCVACARQVLESRDSALHTLDVFLEHGHKNDIHAMHYLRDLKQAIEPIDASKLRADTVTVIERDPLREPMGVKIGALGLGDKTGQNAFPGLQVADALAYSTSTTIRNQSDKFPTDLLDRIEKTTPHYGYIYDTEAITGIVEAVAKDEVQRKLRRQKIFDLKGLLRSYNIGVKELPYGLHLNYSETDATQ